MKKNEESKQHSLGNNFFERRVRVNGEILVGYSVNVIARVDDFTVDLQWQS